MSRSYDNLDHLTGKRPRWEARAIDNADWRYIMTVGQNELVYTFDNANRLTLISQGAGVAVSFTNHNADRRTLLTLPDSVTQAYGYDNNGHGDSHVTSLTYKHGTTTLGSMTFGYDADGRRNTVAGSLATAAIRWQWVEPTPSTRTTR